MKTKNQIKLGATFFPTKDQFGHEINFDSLFIPYIYKEIYLEGVYIDILNQRKDMVILDVGANLGLTVSYFRPHAKKIYAIEPSPEHFTALKKNKEFNGWDNVEIFQVALADKNGEMEFHTSHKNRTTNQLVLGTDNPAWYNTEKFKVKTMAIDTFFEENKIEHVDFVKMDPEGAEDLIMRSDGFKKIVNKIDAIIVEFHDQSWMELVNYITQFGFKGRQYESSAKIVLFTR